MKSLSENPLQTEHKYKTKDEYHADYDVVSKSALGVFIGDRPKYKKIFVDRTEEPSWASRVMDLGSGIDRIVLEGESIDGVFVEYTSECFKKDSKTKQPINSLNPHVSRSFAREAEVEGKLAVKPSDLEIAEQVIEVFNETELKRLLDQGAQTQGVVTWVCPESGLDCRMMYDAAIDHGSYIEMVDLKCTEQIKPLEFRRVCDTLRYWLQDVSYSIGMEVAFGKPVQFSFQVLELGGHFRSARYAYEPQDRAIGKIAYTNAMLDLRHCRDTGFWDEDFVSGINPLYVNRHKVGVREEEIASE